MMRNCFFRSRCLVFLFLFLFLGGISPLVYGYENMFVPFPSLEELVSVKLPEGALSHDSLDGFDNEKGFRFIVDRAQENRVIFFGEYHWSHGVAELFEKVLFLLAQETNLDLVFLEDAYSYGPYYNHYIHESNDLKAIKFFDQYLTHLIASEEVLSLLQKMRLWNKSHSEKPLSIATSDLEWSSDILVEYLLIPYFQELIPAFDREIYLVPDMRGSLKNRGIDKLKKELDYIEKNNLQSSLSFQTPRFIRSIIQNLSDTKRFLEIENDRGLDGAFVHRQKILNRNMVSPTYNGRLFETSAKTLFYGGANHAVKNDKKQLSTNPKGYLSEAEYLNSCHDSTRGKVFSLCVMPFGRNADTYMSYNLDDYGMAEYLRRILTSFQERISYGENILGDYHLLETPSKWDALVIKYGLLHEVNILHFNKVEWDGIPEEIKSTSELYEGAWDDQIYILKSPYITLRK